MQLSNV